MAQTETVELDGELVERARREAARRGITPQQLAELALERWLEMEERAIRRGKPLPKIGVGRSTDGLSAADIADRPVARPDRPPDTTLQHG